MENKEINQYVIKVTTRSNYSALFVKKGTNEQQAITKLMMEYETNGPNEPTGPIGRIEIEPTNSPEQDIGDEDE